MKSRSNREDARISSEIVCEGGVYPHANGGACAVYAHVEARGGCCQQVLLILLRQGPTECRARLEARQGPVILSFLAPPTPVEV